MKSSGVTSDINRAPLERAKKNAAAAGFSDRMDFVLCDGLSGLEPEKRGITDILVCGMGGELIARIVGESEYTRRPGVRLILCPMSQPDKLRAYLAESGFEILDEKLAEAAGEEKTPVSAKSAGSEELGGLSAAFDNAFVNVEWQPGN